MHDQKAKHKALQQSRCTPGHYMHDVPISWAKLEKGPCGVNRIHHYSASLVKNCLYMFHHTSGLLAVTLLREVLVDKSMCAIICDMHGRQLAVRFM